MTPQEFLDEFGTLAESADGVLKLRELILELAVRGKLVEQDETDGSSQDVLDAVADEVSSLVTAKRIKQPPEPSPIEPDDVPFAVPSSWQFAHLENVAVNIHYGYTASANHSLTDVLLVRITDIQDNGVAWATVPGCAIKSEDVSKYELNDDDLLIARTGGTIGKTFLVDNVPQKAVFASYLIRVVPGSGICAAYLKRFLESPPYWSQLYAKSAGTGQPNVNATSLKSLILPVPPLAEQHRIVSKVDELMGLCDRLEAVQGERRGVRVRLNRSSLDRLTSVSGVDRAGRSELSAAWQRVCDHFEVLYDTPETLPDLRQTILQLAVQGKLVPQDPNDEPAEELIAEISDRKKMLVAAKEIAKPKQLPAIGSDDVPFLVPPGWEWIRLESVCEVITKGSSPKWQGVSYLDNADGGIMFVTSENVGNYVMRKLDTPKYVEAKFNEMEPRSILKRSDILVNLVGASIGRSAMWDRDEVANINQAVGIVRLVPGCRSLNRRHLLNYLNSPTCLEIMLGNRVTTAQPNISLTNVKHFLIPVPPLAEQKRIVSKVTHLLSQVTRLESTLTRRESTRTQLLTAAIHAMLNGEEKK